MTTIPPVNPPEVLAGLSPVYAATYDHLGIILWGARKVEQAVDANIAWLERHPGFRIGWDHEAWTYDFLAEHEPQILAKMKAALAHFKGRLGVGSSTYGQPLSMFIDGESNIRQLTLAMDATEKQLGYPMSVYIMSEHPFHAQLPQLLAGAGFKAAILRTHFMMYGFNPEYDEPVGWWVGVDGSRILAVPTYRGQADTPPRNLSIPGNTSTMDNRILTDAVSETCPWTLADLRQRFGHIRPLIATRADDVRNRESLIEAHEGDPDYQWILIEDILTIVPQPRTVFRTAANDFKARMPWGYCGNWMWNRCRHAEVQVETAERLAAISHALGGPAYETEVEQAWKALCVAQHHDIQICGLEDDARTFLTRSVELSSRVAERVMKTVSPRIGQAGQSKRSVVFNPLPWQRTALVETAWGAQLASAPALGFGAVSGAPATATAPAFAWQAQARDDELRLPVRARKGTTNEYEWHDERVGRLTTPFYDAFTGLNGGFRLLRDRQTGRRLMGPPKSSGTLAALVGGKDCASVGAVSDVRIEAQRAIVTEKGAIGGIPYLSQWTFYTHTRRIDWRGEVQFNGEWIGRPKVPVEQASATEHEPEGAINPTVVGYNDHEYKLRLRFYPYVSMYAIGIRDLPFHMAETPDPYIQGLYWTAVSDGATGLALFNRGQMASVRENDGALSSILAFSLPYIWGTRWLKGTYVYELGILPFFGDWRQADLLRQALDYNVPCLVYEETRLENPVGEVWTPFEQTGTGAALLSALYTKGGATYARFWEYAGQSAQVGVAWMGKTVQMGAVDLRESSQGDLGERANLTPWQVQTVRLETAR